MAYQLAERVKLPAHEYADEQSQENARIPSPSTTWGLNPIAAVFVAFWYSFTAAAAMSNGFAYLYKGSGHTYEFARHLMGSCGDRNRNRDRSLSCQTLAFAGWDYLVSAHVGAHAVTTSLGEVRVLDERSIRVWLPTIGDSVLNRNRGFDPLVWIAGDHRRKSNPKG